MAGQTAYQFRVDMRRGWAITSDEPAFRVWLGGRSSVKYEDEYNRVEVGADFSGDRVTLSGRSVRDRIGPPPPGLSDENYQTLVLGRIAAAAEWQRQELVVR